MAPRPQLQTALEGILGSDHVYFQPPANVKMQFPCIVYHRDTITATHADNLPYLNAVRYLVTHISRDPDSAVVLQLAALPLCRFDRFYTADNLNHDAFVLYF